MSTGTPISAQWTCRRRRRYRAEKDRKNANGAALGVPSGHTVPCRVARTRLVLGAVGHDDRAAPSSARSQSHRAGRVILYYLLHIIVIIVLWRNPIEQVGLYYIIIIYYCYYSIIAQPHRAGRVILYYYYISLSLYYDGATPSSRSGYIDHRHFEYRHVHACAMDMPSATPRQSRCRATRFRQAVRDENPLLY